MKQAEDNKTQDMIDELSLAAQIEKGIERLKTVLDTNRAEMQRLKEDGLCNAAEHWRAGKYLYLIYPSQEGERKREYVGADPERITIARRHRENHARFRQIERENREVEGQLREVKWKMEAVARLLKVPGFW